MLIGNSERKKRLVRLRLRLDNNNKVDLKYVEY
jgi:hypothetical protein